MKATKRIGWIGIGTVAALFVMGTAGADDVALRCQFPDTPTVDAPPVNPSAILTEECQDVDRELPENVALRCQFPDLVTVDLPPVDADEELTEKCYEVDQLI